MICLINVSFGDSIEQQDRASSLRNSNQTEIEVELSEFKNDGNTLDEIVQEQFNIYKEKIKPYKRLRNQESVEDLESSHDYFKQFAVLRLQAAVTNIASANKTLLSSKLEEKIEKFYKKDFENLLRSESERALIIKDDAVPTFLPLTCKFFRITLIADLDGKSRVKKTDDVYRSFLKTGLLMVGASKGQVEFDWDDELKEIKSGFSFKGN